MTALTDRLRAERDEALEAVAQAKAILISNPHDIAGQMAAKDRLTQARWIVSEATERIRAAKAGQS
jgi:hypothetical protein